MTCDRRELLNRYIDGDLGAQEASEMRRHITSCPDCSREYHEIMQSEKTVRDTLVTVIDSMPLRETVMKRIESEHLLPERKIEQPSASSSLSKAFAWCLGIVIVAITSIMLYRGIISPPPIRIPKEMVVIMGLRGNSIYGNKVLPPEASSFALEEAVPMRGTFGLFLHGIHNQPTIFSGSAAMRLQFGRIDWVEGEGALAGPPDEKVLVNVGSEAIVINDGCVVFKGSASECSVMLATGTAYHIKGDTAEYLIVNEQCASIVTSQIFIEPPASSVQVESMTASETQSNHFKHPIFPIFDILRHIAYYEKLNAVGHEILSSFSNAIESASSNANLSATTTQTFMQKQDSFNRKIKNPFINPLPGRVE